MVYRGDKNRVEYEKKKVNEIVNLISLKVMNENEGFSNENEGFSF